MGSETEHLNRLGLGERLYSVLRSHSVPNFCPSLLHPSLPPGCRHGRVLMAWGGLFLLLPRLCPGDGPFHSLKQKHAGHLPGANHGTTEQTHPTGLIKGRWGSTWGFPTRHKRPLFVFVNLFQARVISCWEAGAICRE